MDMLVGFIQIVCIAGLLYGLYLSITYVEPAELAESYDRLRPHHFACDPLITDAVVPPRPLSRDRLVGL